MNLMHKFYCKLLCIIFWLSGSYGYAQVLAPDFICVKNDTLVWTPVSNLCGPFESYDIYFSSMPSGPYSLLARITDASETKYFHTNPADLTWYYYIESNHDCPGQIFLKSDTLDNRSPDIPDIESLSTIDNTVEIKWKPSTSPETEGYIIYRVLGNGTVPIDTVFGDVTYLDLSANPIEKDETYFVLALDACGNTSLFGDPQTTYRLNHEVIECLQEIVISWIPTNNFANGIFEHEIWIGENGSAPILFASIDGAANEFTVSEAKEGVEYCIFVKAVSNGDRFEANTNTVCITPTIVEPVRDLYFKNLDVQIDGNVEVTWVWNEDAAIISTVVESQVIGGTNGAESPINLTTPLVRTNTFRYTDLSANANQLEFQIKTSDECDSLKRSGFASPIFLSIGTDGGLNNTCLWTPLKIPKASVEKYEIFRSMNGRSEVVGEVDFSTTDFTDNLSVNDVTNGEMCYYVRATSNLTHSDGTIEEIFSTSNQICKTVSAKIFMPNAFAPRGRNQILKPVISFGTPKEFKMLVYNRYGTLLYETNDIDDGWNGRVEGKVAPAGVYSYLIKMIQQDGSAEQLSGFVMLVQ